MIFRSTILAALLGLSVAEEIQMSNLRNLKKSNIFGNEVGNRGLRRMTKPCTLIQRVEAFEDQSVKYEWDCELEADDAGNGSRIISFKNRQFAKNQFKSGETTLDADVMIDGDSKATIIGGDLVYGQKWNKDNKDDRHLATTADTTKTVLVIRIDAADFSTTASEQQLSDDIFGTSGDSFNLATGYEECSSNSLKFIAGVTNAGEVQGVHTVTLTENVADYTDSQLRTLALDKTTEVYGDLASTYNHVMVCLPNIPLFGGIAYAYINSWLSVYNDDWCSYPSAQLHEIGHNLNLAHSGEGATYDDQTGMMGFSYSQDEGPRMCFNNAKNWQLGWYLDKRTSVAPLTTSSAWTGDLVGVAQYSDIVLDNQFVILQVVGDVNKDYYVGFNRAIGINSGTREAQNQVTIQSRATGIGFAQSTLVAKLSGGQSYSIPNFGNSINDVTIEVVSIDLSSSPQTAKVNIYKNGETIAPVNPPTNPPVIPTRAPTNPPTNPPVIPTRAPTNPPTNPPVIPTRAPTTNNDWCSFKKKNACKRIPDCKWNNNAKKCSLKPAFNKNCSSMKKKICKRSQKCKWRNRECKEKSAA